MRGVALSFSYKVSSLTAPSGFVLLSVHPQEAPPTGERASLGKRVVRTVWRKVRLMQPANAPSLSPYAVFLTQHVRHHRKGGLLGRLSTARTVPRASCNILQPANPTSLHPCDFLRVQPKSSYTTAGEGFYGNLSAAETTSPELGPDVMRLAIQATAPAPDVLRVRIAAADAPRWEVPPWLFAAGSIAGVRFSHLVKFTTHDCKRSYFLLNDHSTCPCLLTRCFASCSQH